MDERNITMSRLFAVKPLVIATIFAYTLVFVCTPQYSKAEDGKNSPKTVQGSGYQTGEWSIPGAVSSGELIALGALAVVGVVVLIAVLNHKGDNRYKVRNFLQFHSLLDGSSFTPDEIKYDQTSCKTRGLDWALVYEHMNNIRNNIKSFN
jgi:hypothetical protein